MAMPQPATDWTVERLDAIPDDGQRREIIDGELFVNPPPSFRHQRLLMELAIRLTSYAREQSVGLVLPLAVDIRYSRTTNVQPDLVVYPYIDGRAPREKPEPQALLLAVEVLSPRTARVDRGKKRRLYQREGLREYWIVDLDAQVIERWRPSDERPEIMDGTLAWRPEGAVLPLELDLRELFASVLD